MRSTHRVFILAATVSAVFLIHSSAAAAQDTDPVCTALLESSENPPADEPTPQQAKKLADCDSERLYYGERSPASLVAARHCAYVEREGYDLPTVSGPAVLMMLYANGLGVARNLELAQTFNCEVGGSVEEIAARRARLEAWAKGDKSREFDICDGAAVGFLKEICDGKAARLAEAKPRKP
jgi:hypothetical protein